MIFFLVSQRKFCLNDLYYLTITLDKKSIFLWTIFHTDNLFSIWIQKFQLILDIVKIPFIWPAHDYQMISVTLFRTDTVVKQLYLNYRHKYSNSKYMYPLALVINTFSAIKCESYELHVCKSSRWKIKEQML